MGLSGSTRRIIFGFTVATGIILGLSYLAFGAAPNLGHSGRFRGPGIHRQDSFLHPFQRFGVLGVDGVGDQSVIIIQQFQPPPTSESRETSKNGIYVPPQWVDGGHGVEILRPGYWTDR